MTYSNSASTPGSSTTNFGEIGKDWECSLVAQRDVDHAMVRQRAHRGSGSALLATALRSGRNEESGVLAPLACVSVRLYNVLRVTYIGSLLPLLASGIEESLPLGREVAEAGWDAE